MNRSSPGLGVETSPPLNILFVFNMGKNMVSGYISIQTHLLPHANRPLYPLFSFQTTVQCTNHILLTYASTRARTAGERISPRHAGLSALFMSTLNAYSVSPDPASGLMVNHRTVAL